MNAKMLDQTSMEVISHQTFEGERPLFKTAYLDLRECHFTQGESAVKVSHHIKAERCTFASKYLFWHNDDVVIEHSHFLDGGRASIWYSNNIALNHSKVDAPKIFRDAQNISIKECTLKTNETLWDCQNIDIKDSCFEGDYLLLHSDTINIEQFTLNGNYSFQHTKDVTIKNATITSKDAFWNSENVTVYDSIIDGEYLGWYSKNLKLVNCKISGTQPLCYAENLIMDNCEMINTDLAFEYSTLHVTINNSIDSVKNPFKGVIQAKEIKELILDDEKVQLNNIHFEASILKKQCTL